VLLWQYQCPSTACLASIELNANFLSRRHAEMEAEEGHRYMMANVPLVIQCLRENLEQDNRAIFVIWWSSPGMLQHQATPIWFFHFSAGRPLARIHLRHFLDIATSHADAAAFSIRLLHWTQPRCGDRYGFLWSPPWSKLFQITKICKSPRLTVMFSGIKISVSSSMPIRPYP
jgi:hypothetical protein